MRAALMVEQMFTGELVGMARGMALYLRADPLGLRADSLGEWEREDLDARYQLVAAEMATRAGEAGKGAAWEAVCAELGVADCRERLEWAMREFLGGLTRAEAARFRGGVSWW